MKYIEKQENPHVDPMTEAVRNELKTPLTHGKEQVMTELKTMYRPRAKRVSKDHSHSIVYTQEKSRLQVLVSRPLGNEYKLQS